MNTDDIIDLFFPLKEHSHVLLPEIKIHASTNYELIAKLVEWGAIPNKWAANQTYGNIYVGGAHLSRFILDNPNEVQGKRVWDIGSGSGIVAIAAAMAGASHITALDRDDIAIEFIRRNTRANNVDVEILHMNALNAPYKGADVITAADIFLDQSHALQKMLFAQASKGICVLAASGGPFPVEYLALRGTPLRPGQHARKLYGEPEFFAKFIGRPIYS